jgi:hypothetical protein
VKRFSGLICLFFGLVLCGLGLYFHYRAVADIPAAAMTMRLQWSGWELGIPGAASQAGNRCHNLTSVERHGLCWVKVRRQSSPLTWVRRIGKSAFHFDVDQPRTTPK